MAFELPEEWLKDGRRTDDLADQCVDTDKWDREDLRRAVHDVSEFDVARDELQKFTPTGKQAENDTFWSLLKAQPRLLPHTEIKPELLVNLSVAEAMRELSEYQQARRFAVGDDVQAALMAAQLEPDLEILFDKKERSKAQAQELADALNELAQATADVDQTKVDLDEMFERWTGQKPPKSEDEEEGDGDGEGEGDEGEGEGEGDADGAGKPGSKPGKSGTSPAGQGSPDPDDAPGDLTDKQKEAYNEAAKAVREAQERQEAAQQKVQDTLDKLNDMTEREASDVRAILQEAFTKVADEAQGMRNSAFAWGTSQGELRRMPADERMELARKLNSDRMRKIADKFGAMHNMMLSEQVKKTRDAREEIRDIELGDDLGRILPSEMLLLDDEDGQWEFMRRFTENQLLQFEMDGDEHLARGAIIFCEDGSGSMGGERELWAKAIMLCLLHHARDQNRQMHVIHFGGPGEFKTVSFETPAAYTVPAILDAAEPWWGGGTDFATPMKEALRILQEEHAKTGKVTADIVFCTDDECWVDDEFMEYYLSEMVRMKARTWGISVSGYDLREGALSKMTSDAENPTGKCCTVTDFSSTSDDIRFVFRGI